MKLTLPIKLLPSEEQARTLLNTIRQANQACNVISETAWQQKIFQKFKLHRAAYHAIRGTSQLSSQLLIRCLSKVADAYKGARSIKRVFRPLGSVPYDSRILSYQPNHTVSIWTVGGRLRLPFVCHHPLYLSSIRGEAKLLHRKGKFYLLQTIEIQPEVIGKAEGFIGVDFGLTDIAVTSEGKKYSSKTLNAYRAKRQKVRSSLQRKGTKGAKRLLKRLSGRERRTGTLINHTISKDLVSRAKATGSGIALEELKGIRSSADNWGKKHRSRLGRWSFYQLRQFLEYKTQLNGILCITVCPAYTSKTCHQCRRIGRRKNKVFRCNNCKAVFDADENAAKNIALLGAIVNCPEKSEVWSCSLHF